MTTVGARLDYARILVEVNTDKQLPESIPIEGPDGIVLSQQVVYEWNTKKCEKCKLVGHITEQCRRGKTQNRKEGQQEAPQEKIANSEAPQVQTKSLPTPQQQAKEVEENFVPPAVNQPQKRPNAAEKKKNLRNSSKAPDGGNAKKGNANSTTKKNTEGSSSKSKVTEHINMNTKKNHDGVAGK